MPKSTRQISPGNVLFMLGFHGVERLEPLQRPLVALGERLGIFFGFDDVTHDFPAVGVRQFRDFRNDFRSAHNRNLSSSQCVGKSNSHAASQFFGHCFKIYFLISALFPCAPRPSSSANFFTVFSAFLSDARLYSTTLVRRWNWSTVRPANDAPAPSVGSTWLGPAT